MFFNRKDCVFFQKDQCAFPKVLKVCCLCNCYLKNDGAIKDNLPYISFVMARIINGKMLFLSVFALIAGIISAVVGILSIFPKIF